MKGPVVIRKGTGAYSDPGLHRATWVYETVTPLLPWGKLYLSE